MIAGFVTVSMASVRIALSHGGTAFVDADAFFADSGLGGFHDIEVAGRWQVTERQGTIGGPTSPPKTWKAR